jgi:endonuclease/exonuclease/phosphatase family metal-dependent hydrolase
LIYITYFVKLVVKNPKLNKYNRSLFLFFLICKLSFSQIPEDSELNPAFRLMFYNVENYFDYSYDTALTYNEFTPLGNLHWTKRKYEKKRNDIYKVIKAVGAWKPVTLIGLAEVENEFVVSELVNKTPLRNDGYDYIHYDSKDKRGIDVAIVYHKESFTIINSKKIEIRDPENRKFTTRDLLYVVGLINNDTIHIVVNHWTSRYRGYLESEPLRLLAAERVLKLTDSIYSLNSRANILLMGDFNDNPNNNSMTLLVNNSKCSLYNLPLNKTNQNVNGTLKYKNNWALFDQILVSGNLTDSTNIMKCEKQGVIFDADFLLRPDNKYLGVTTFRTNLGYNYKGGFSDHLPVYIDLYVNK